MVRTLADRLRADIGAHVVLEQRAPHLDRQAADGSVTESRLDLVVTDKGRTYWVGVVITDPWCSDLGTLRARLVRDGMAAEAAEGTKHRRYGVTVVPFALETGGRWGALGRAWWSRLYSRLPAAARGACGRALSACLQTSLACGALAAC